MVRNTSASLAARVALDMQSGVTAEEAAKKFDVSEAQATLWHTQLVQRAYGLYGDVTLPDVPLVGSVAQAIAENSPQAIAVLNSDGVCVYVNKSFIGLFGYSTTELLSSPLHQLIHHRRENGEHYPKDECPLVHALAVGTPLANIEDVFITKDDRDIKVIYSTTSIIDELGRAYSVLEARDLSREVELQRSLTLNQKRLEKLFSADLIGVIYWTLEGDIENANNEFLRMVKYDREDLEAGRIDWRRMTPEEFSDGDTNAIKFMKEHGYHSAITKQYICKDGTRVWIAVASALVDDRHGVAFVQDITREKQALEALQVAQNQALEEKARLSALLEAAPVGIGMCDQNGRIIEMNRGNRVLWGQDIPYSESVEKYAEWRGWWADDTERRGQLLKAEEWAMARALRGEDHLNDIVEIEPFDAPGTRKTILNCAAPVRDNEGKIIGAVVAQMDLTERVRAELALRESELKFRTITDAMPQMVFSTLPNGYNDYLNKHLYEFTGEEPGSLEGYQWERILHPEDKEDALRKWERCLASGEPYEIKYRVKHHDGSYRWALGRALPIRNSEQKIVRWLGTCTDIHEQVVIQEALEDADRKKDDFIALLAHELRNPLAPVRTALETV